MTGWPNLLKDEKNGELKGDVAVILPFTSRLSPHLLTQLLTSWDIQVLQ